MRTISWNKRALPVILMTILALAAAFPAIAADETPKIAVYVTGGRDVSENKVLMTLILDALIKSGRYEAVERTDDFVAQIDREQAKQRSGAVDDNQIRQVGIQAGVQFVCVVNMECAFGSCLISARIIDVETAKVAAMSTAESRLGSMEEIRRISKEIVASMLNYRTPPPTQPSAQLTGKAESDRQYRPKATSEIARTTRKNYIGARYGFSGATDVEAVFTSISKSPRGKRLRADLMVGYNRFEAEYTYVVPTTSSYPYYGNGTRDTTITRVFSGLGVTAGAGWPFGDDDFVTGYLGGLLAMPYGGTGNGFSYGVGYGIMTGIECNLWDLTIGLDIRPMFYLLFAIEDVEPFLRSGERGAGAVQGIALPFKYSVGLSAKYRF